MSLMIYPGVRTLSRLAIDTHKDWGQYSILNIGAPPADIDALSRGLVDIHSIDYGLNWVDLGVIGTERQLAMDYLGNGIAIFGNQVRHVFRSTDYGATWADLGLIASGSVGPRSMGSLGNGIACFGDINGRIFRSTDYGATWVDLGVISADMFQSIAYLGNGIVIMGDQGGRIFRSTDYGATWADLGVIAVGSLTSMAYLGSGIALAADARAYRSIDYGLTWVNLGLVSPTSNIYGMLYLGNGIVSLPCYDRHIYRSTDYGLTFTDQGVFTDRFRGTAYLGNGIVIAGDNDNHVVRSTDYGATWTDLGALAVGTPSIVCMAYLGNGIAILGDWSWHVWRSTSAFQLGNFNPNQFDKAFQFGCLGAITPNGTSYLAPGNGATQLNEIRARAPRSGILRNLYVWQRVASGVAGITDIYTVRVNGVNTAITCTLDNATEGADTVNEAVVAAGDQVSIRLVSNNALDASADVAATVELT